MDTEHEPSSHDDPSQLPMPPAGHPVRDRWLAAIGYLGPFCLLPMLTPGKSAFLRWHAQQAFVLFFIEAVVLTLILIVDSTVGRIPVLGFLISILLQLAAFVVFLILSILGFVKGLAGEDFRLPVLEDYADRVPVSD